jgi:hypothetical protein
MLEGMLTTARLRYPSTYDALNALLPIVVTASEITTEDISLLWSYHGALLLAISHEPIGPVPLIASSPLPVSSVHVTALGLFAGPQLPL